MPNKATAEIKALAQSYGPKAVRKLAYLMDNGDSQQVIGFACKELLDRGYGKPTQMIAGDKDGDAIQLQTSMTDVAKLLLLKIGGE